MSNYLNHITFTLSELKEYRRQATEGGAKPFEEWLTETRLARFKKSIRHGSKKPVATPLGVYETATEAARAHNIPLGKMRDLANLGKGGFYYINKDTLMPESERTKKLKLPKQHKPKVKRRNHKTPVSTPIGVFDSCYSAAAELNMTHGTVYYRASKQIHGFSFVGEACIAD